jgi:16S rRNA processing protein RimM
MPEASGSDPKYLVIARIVSPQGNKGEVKTEVVTDFPERFASTPAVYLGEEYRRYELDGYRLQGRVAVLKLRDVESMEQAERLRGDLVHVPEEEAVELPTGHYFWHQIMGLRVVTVEGETIGTVDDILETGSNDVYVVHGPGGEQLIPAIKDVVKGIDLEKGIVTVQLLPWLD